MQLPHIMKSIEQLSTWRSVVETVFWSADTGIERVEFSCVALVASRGVGDL